MNVQDQFVYISHMYLSRSNEASIMTHMPSPSQAASREKKSAAVGKTQGNTCNASEAVRTRCRRRCCADKLSRLILCLFCHTSRTDRYPSEENRYFAQGCCLRQRDGDSNVRDRQREKDRRMCNRIFNISREDIAIAGRRAGHTAYILRVCVSSMRARRDKFSRINSPFVHRSSSPSLLPPSRSRKIARLTAPPLSLPFSLSLSLAFSRSHSLSLSLSLYVHTRCSLAGRSGLRVDAPLARAMLVA